ncbi:GNAT family N-acetyltransferase [Paenibacillus thailandensis]|uniref:GNAT family N-acetyltransferase n=1 Tax=Paenibacillus thailandensis TaxID=393250 RepID=A0ABW5R1R9_9BACL
MNIRLLTADDALAYRTIRLESLLTNPEAFSASYEEESAYPIDRFSSRLSGEHSFTFGAFDRAELVGTVTLVCEQRAKLRHRAYIYAMYVTPLKRGQGIAKALLERALQRALEYGGIEQVHLTVAAGNAGAKRLYRSYGFEAYATEINALKLGESYYDEEFMVYFLDNRRDEYS